MKGYYLFESKFANDALFYRNGEKVTVIRTKSSGKIVTIRFSDGEEVDVYASEVKSIPIPVMAEAAYQ